MTDVSSGTGANGSSGENLRQSDNGGSRSEIPSSQQAADRLDSYGKNDAGSQGETRGSASNQDAADKLDQAGKGGSSDYIEAPRPPSSDAPSAGGSSPSGTGASYDSLSEPYSNLPRSGGGSGEPETKLRMPSGLPAGGEEPKIPKKQQPLGNDHKQMGSQS